MTAFAHSVEAMEVILSGVAIRAFQAIARASNSIFVAKHVDFPVMLEPQVQALLLMSTRVLVVDDIAANVRLLEARLRSDFFSVESVPDGMAALTYAHEKQPDLILLDVMMPGMDGFLCCRVLKAERTTAHIPVVMLTALSDVDEKVRGLEAGADDFLSKPVEYDVLITRVSNLVRMKRLFDEWRARNDAMSSFGLISASAESEALARSNILLIGATAVDASLVTTALALEKAEVFAKHDAAEALEAVEVCPPRLIIVVVSSLPNKITRLVSAIRSNQGSHSIPVLLAVQPEDKAVATRCFDLGASDWVMLPFEAAELRARCRNLLRKTFYQESIKENYQIAIQAALVDPLTSLYNRRFLSHYLQTASRFRKSQDVAILMVDIDHFKSINDAYGHSSGDRILKGVASVILSSVGRNDVVVRYGGEEFVAIMPRCTLQDAKDAANVIRERVEQQEFTSDRRPVTLSIGLAYGRDGILALEQILEAADKALYKAKHGGRNRVEAVTVT